MFHIEGRVVLWQPMRRAWNCCASVKHSGIADEDSVPNVSLMVPPPIRCIVQGAQLL
jgi:hypothetical protein